MAAPNMNLSLPTVTVTLGPTWASQLNIALETIDSHDHTSGKGLRITPAAMNINDDLNINDNNLNNVKITRYSNQASSPNGVDDIRCIYVSDNNLYYNNEAGVAVQITSGSGLNASSIGAIGGDYGTSSASVTYSTINKTFTFDQSSGVRALLDVSDIKIREATSNANYVQLKSPSSLGANYDLTFPTALPTTGETKFVTLDSTGQLAVQWDVDNLTTEVSSNLLQVKDSGITTSKLDDNAVSTSKINNSAVTTAKLNDGAVTQVKKEIRAISANGSDPGSGGVSQSAALTLRHTITSASFVDINNLSTTLTTNGGPVVVALVSTTNGGYVELFAANDGNSATDYGAQVQFLRDSSQLAAFDLYLQPNSDVPTDGLTIRYPSGSFYHITNIAAGTYTFKAQARVTVGTNTNIRVQNVRLIAYEL